MKKIIALMFALTVIISILNISVFADDTSLGGIDHGGGSSGGNRDVVALNEFETAFAETTQKYVDGDITYTEWNEQQNALLEDFYNKNTSASGDVIAPAYAIGKRFEGFAKKIGETVSTFGDDARQRVADWWNGVTSDVPTETVQIPTTDMNGYGVKIIVHTPNNGYDVIYSDYLIIYLSLSGTYDAKTSYGFYKEGYQYDGNTNSHYLSNSFTSDSYSSWNDFLSGLKRGMYEIYGDVRYEDGTQYPTGEDFETVTIKKFDDMPAPDLDDLLNDFAEELERQMPDLSTIEGLLKAIYARMGKLDSDNDNALLSTINASILKLVNADKDKPDSEGNTNEELVNTLLEIRDMIKEGDFGTSPEGHGHEISGTVYNVIPLDKDWLNNMVHNRQNLKVNYQGQTYYLEDCGCLKLGDKYYTPNMNYDEYSSDYYNIDDLPSFSFDSTYTYSNGDVQSYAMSRDGLPPVDDFLEAGNSVIQPYIDKAVNEMAKAFTIGIPYDDIKGSIGTFQSIVFNNHEPKDVVITMFGKNVTILSAEFNSYLTGGISSGGGNNNFNYGDLISGGNSHGGFEHGGGGSGGNRDNNSNSSDIVAYSDSGNSSTSVPALATYVKIVRSFSSILIGFTWTLSMRKKIVAMI